MRRDGYERSRSKGHIFEVSWSADELLNNVTQKADIYSWMATGNPRIEDTQIPSTILVRISPKAKRLPVPMVVRKKEVETPDVQPSKGIEHFKRVVVEIDHGNESIRLTSKSLFDTPHSPDCRLVA